MKKLLSLVLAIAIMVCVVPFGAFTLTASAATSGKYTYTVSNGEATITDVNETISGAITIPSTLGGYPVTSIGNSAFYFCESITSITIPDSVTKIGNAAFFYCSNLTSITIPNSVTRISSEAFYSCGSLMSITIPDSVTSIGYDAFYSCYTLTSITIPDSVKSIGHEAFLGCSKLNDVYYGGSYADRQKISIDSCNSNLTSARWHYRDAEPLIYEFDETNLTASVIDCEESTTTVTIPNQITENGKIYNVISISEYAFEDCANLTNIIISDYVTSIGNYAFKNCDSLTSITIPDGVTSIDSSSFSGCTSLESITIPDSVTSIGNGAFYSCQNLQNIEVDDGNEYFNDIDGILFNKDKTTILCYPAGKTEMSYTIPDSVTSIGDYAFDNCISLTSITIPDSVTSIGNEAFSNCTSLKTVNYNAINCTNMGSYYYSVFSSCKKLTTINIGDKVKTIPDRAFENCTALTSITIPDSVTSIGSSSFSGCTSLECITIPDSVTSIGNYAFENCDSLKSITIPDSVTSIGDDAFSGCEKLQNIEVDDGNEYFSDIDGILFNKDKTTILRYPAGKTEMSYTIPDSVTSIGNYAFDYCDSLTSITIPDSVTNIGNYAFDYCTGLELVYYAGNNRSDIYILWGNNPLEDATWYYNVCDEHKYDNDCDDSCNICGVPRTVGDHKYDNDCDDSCNICGATRMVGEHKYDNNCDDSCNICGAKRTVGEHKYDNDCDTTCNYCGATRTVGEHKYDNDYDDRCNSCQAKRICDVCSGSGKDLFEVDCDNCTDGVDGSVICSRCYGTGKYIEACSSCGGYGHNDYGTECSKCKGTGNGASVSCYSCSGTGEVPAHCKKCDGDHLVEVEGYCLNCLGEGNVDIYKITFDTKGGAFKFSEYAISGHNKTLPTEIPTRAGYTFAGWGTTQKCGKQYSPGELYDIEDDITFYALWYELTTCDTCNGSGKIDRDCFGCYGAGKSTYRACNNCGSTRYNQTGTMGTICMSCGGRSFSTKTVYCDLCNGSGKGNCNTCDGKGKTAIKQKPTVFNFNDTVVTLVFKEGYEYSKDGVAWQKSNVFTNLLPVTKYTFYTRVGATNTTPFSAMSSGVSITTDKSKQTLVPSAPTVQSCTSSSITLVAIDGCEYSKDGTVWQSSNVFTGLSCAKKYKFYQRYKETATTYTGKSSAALVAKTDKGTQSKPSAPTLLSKTYNSVTLVALSGYEYSYDGINWQTNNVFRGLDAETNYIFYQRKAENDKYYASEISASLIVKTSEAPKCVINPLLHKYGNKCDAECDTCGAIRKVSHKYTTTTTKATLTKNGKVVKKCKVCSKVASTTTIKYVKSFKLSTTSYTYNGKVKTPSVVVKDSAGKTLKKNTDYTVSYASGRKNVGTYKVTIKMKGNYSGTKTLTFKINPVKTSVSKLTAGKKSITVNISKKSTQVTGYEVQYSTSKKFASAKTKVVNYKTTKVALKSLSAKKTYYVRVRTYKTVSGKKYYSSWSAYKNAKTK